MVKMFYVVAAALSIACVSPAFAERYRCKLAMSESGGKWMGPVVHVNYDRDDKEAFVIDSVIDHYLDGPLKVSGIEENDNLIRFTYKTSAFRGSSSGKPGVTYANRTFRLTILKTDLKARISMKAAGYRNSWRDTGACTQKP